MGWFWNNLKGIVDPKLGGESIIEAMERIYRREQQTYPELDPHYLLGRTWLIRMKTHGLKQDEITELQSLTKTYVFAHLPFPQNVRALGISIIMYERPDVMRQCPEFDSEYDELLRPVSEAEQRGTMLELYFRYNPRMAAERDKA